MKRGAAIAEYVPCEFEVCRDFGKSDWHYTSSGLPHPNPHPHKVLCLKNIPRGSRKSLPGQSCYGLNPATGAGRWVYFVGAVLALASVPMLLRN